MASYPGNISKSKQDVISATYNDLLASRDGLIAAFEVSMNAAHLRELVVDSVISGLLVHFQEVAATPDRYAYMGEGHLSNIADFAGYINRMAGAVSSLFENLNPQPSGETGGRRRPSNPSE